jgi:hypothetical protein
MSLQSIVAALGGDLYARGSRANVPAPGHSAHDRSVSLRLVDGRVLVHAFNGADWREILDDLRARNLIDDLNRPTGLTMAVGLRPGRPEPSDHERIDAARRLWEDGRPVAGSLSETHLRLRRVRREAPGPDALRHHPAAPISAYRPRAPTRPALLAGIRGPDGELTAVEITYLDPNGQRTRRLRLPRKTVGVIAPSSAVRLDPVEADLLVGEGVFTVLSAAERFGRPGWALMSTRNLRSWRAPDGVRSVWIAADRGKDGERSARELSEALRQAGVQTRILLPPRPHGDWNDAAPAVEPVRRQRQKVEG